MIPMIAALALFAPTYGQLDVEVTEDVWVYSHANDAGSDPFLRVFGAGGNAVAQSVGDLESFSYGYLKIDTANLPKDRKLVGAELVFTPAGKPTVDPAAKDWPLEVRPLKGTFTEKTWTHDMASEVAPSKTIVYGGGTVKATAVAETFEIRVNLLDSKSTFNADFGKAVQSASPLFLALTSKYDAPEQGMKGIYKVFSRDNKDKSVRPRLELKFAD